MLTPGRDIWESRRYIKGMVVGKGKKGVHWGYPLH